LGLLQEDRRLVLVTEGFGVGPFNVVASGCEILRLGLAVGSYPLPRCLLTLGLLGLTLVLPLGQVIVLGLIALVIDRYALTIILVVVITVL
jgi:hypothetical protein